MVAFCYHGRMAQPVKLSDALVLDARLEAELQQRSIAGQVEYWAKLGQSAAQLLDGRRVRTLLERGATESLSEVMGLVDTPQGRLRVKKMLENRPFPHFEQHPEQSELLIRTEADGRKTVGRFINREFVEAVAR